MDRTNSARDADRSYSMDVPLFPDDANRQDSKHRTSIVLTPRNGQADVNRSTSEHQTPIGNTSRTLVTADWERGIGWLIHNGETTSEMTREDFLAGKLFYEYPDSLLVVEAAHLQERKGSSLSQVYDRDELKALDMVRAEQDVQVKVFPQKLTPRARDYSDLEKAADGDVRAIHTFTLAHPEIGMMTWRLPGEREQALWGARAAIRDDMNVRLNQMRVRGYKGVPEYERASRLVHQLWAGNRLSAEACRMFQITVKGRRQNRIDFNDCALMSVYVAVFDESGNLRVNSQGRFIGVRGVRGVIQLSPYHFKSGTARSNLMWHRLRNELHEKDNGQRDPEGRREFSHAVTDLIQAFRDAD